MDHNQYYEYTPNSVDFSGYERGESNKIPYGFLGLYLVLSVIICYLYYIKIVAAATLKPFQYS